MCGINAYWGPNPAASTLINGLKRLEYRGYDSAGIAMLGRTDPTDAASTYIRTVKKQGKVSVLEDAAKGTVFGDEFEGTHVGIAHTRWATHGAPSDVNSHPHSSPDGKIAVVHNGIIENFGALRTLLKNEGYEFKSETDTELLVALVHKMRQMHPEAHPWQLVANCLTEVEGTFACCFLFADYPDTLIGARRGSPMLMGVGDGEFWLASDASAVIEHTKQVHYLNEDEMVIISPEYPQGFALQSTSLRGTPRNPDMVKLDLSLEAIEKGGYKHFMLKEIMEQPTVLRNCMRGRVDTERGEIRLGGLLPFAERILAARRIIIVGCGTSLYSGMVAEYAIEDLARVPVEVEYASEFRYRNPVLNEDDVVMAISQSGETADTMAAIRMAKERGALTIGIVNTVGSSIARETDCGAYLHVGPEIGVASTKAFTGQVCVLTMFALMLAQARGTQSDEEIKRLVQALDAMPEAIARVLESADTLRELSKSYRFASSFLFLARGYNFPVALEGALKLKEISYIHAEGYASAEMKHGPIALIDKFLPVVVLALKSDPLYDKVRSNVEEVLARGGTIIAVTEEDNHDFDDQAEEVIRVPSVPVQISPLLNVVPLQLLSYHIADMRKCAIDMPRNLAKSVVVE